MPNSSRPSRIPSTNATPNSRNGSATTSIPTPTTLKGSPRKLPPSPKLGLGSPPAKARDVANPRPSPDAYTDALVIATEWEQFRALDLDRLRDLMACPVVIDLRNIYCPEDMN